MRKILPHAYYRILESYLTEVFNWYSVGGGGVQLGPLGTAAINRPIVPAPGDRDDGEICGMIGRGTRSTRRKPATMPPQTPHMLPGCEPGPPRWETSD
jgi:hypothetical protein